jgi:hypothetical protein
LSPQKETPLSSPSLPLPSCPNPRHPLLCFVSELACAEQFMSIESCTLWPFRSSFFHSASCLQHPSHVSIFLFFFLQYWGLNSGPTPWVTPPALLFCEGFFWDMKSFFEIYLANYLPWLASNHNSPDLASWVARITGLSHWCLAIGYVSVFCSSFPADGYFMVQIENILFIPFMRWRTFGWFPPFGCCKECCCDHTHPELLFEHSFLILLGVYLEVELLGQMVIGCFTYWRTWPFAHAIFLWYCVYSITNPCWDLAAPWFPFLVASYIFPWVMQPW